jgi:Flp pilus assembly protein CpaB
LSFHERLFFIGGGAMLFAVFALAIIVIYSQGEADAGEMSKGGNIDANADSLSVERIMILAPKDDVAQGTRLGAQQFAEISWPRNDIPEGAIRRIEEVEGMYAKADLVARQPLLRTNLSQTQLVGGVSDLIPPGHRASTIKVDDTTGVEFWTTAGSHVDVLVTYHDKEDGKEKTQIAIEDAVVISYNGNTARGAKPDMSGGMLSRPTNTATVTLAVPVIDSVRLATIQAMGKISLVLRPPGEMKSAGNLTVSATDISQQSPGKTAKQTAHRPNGRVQYRDRNGVQRDVEIHGEEWIETSEDKPN